jgi:hypothetical protein
MNPLPSPVIGLKGMQRKPVTRPSATKGRADGLADAVENFVHDPGQLLLNLSK